MMKKSGLFYAFMVLLCTLFSLTLVSSAYAKSVTIAIAAEAAYVDDPSNILNGEINVGTIITGYYTYESTTPDSNSLLEVGDYWHVAAPYGIYLTVGQRIFETDPNNVSFLVEIVNDYYQMDNYVLRSYKNIASPALPNGAIVEHIAWQLDDYTATALNSSALPASAPVLANWQSIFGLTIEGCIPDPAGFCGFERFFIRAHVASATPVGESVTATIDIKPDTLNRKSNGEAITAYVELPREYAVEDIEPDSIVLSMINGQGLVAPLHRIGPTEIGDYDGDNVADLMVKFNRQELISLVAPGKAELSLSGKLADGTPIKGSDSITIIGENR